MTHNSLPALRDLIESRVREGDLETPLETIQTFVEGIVSDVLATGKVFSASALDALCLMVGARVLSQTNVETRTPSKGRIVYVATEFYRHGGHTLLAADFVRYLPNREHIFLITDLLSNPHRDAPELRLAPLGANVEVAPSGSRLEKLKWLLTRLSQLAPERIYWFNHHQDAVAIAAAQPEIPGEKYFIHHGDHQLCLGVQLPHLHHVDLTNLGFFNCRDTLGIADNEYWPLVCEDLGPPNPRRRFIATGRLRTCTSGSGNKFEIPYLYDYADVLACMLHATGGDHLHVGYLSEGYLERIRDRLNDEKISQERFIYIPWVPSLWRTLIDREVDVNLTSWPVGSGKALIEAMGAGIPTAIHINYISRFHSGFDLGYPQALVWRTPSDLIDHLTKLTPERLAIQSRAARVHYESHHRPEILASLLRRDDANGAPEPIPLRNYQPDALQIFLDQRAQQDENLAAHHKDAIRLEKAVAEREAQIISLTQTVAERDGQIAAFTQTVAERDAQIANLTLAEAERARLSQSLEEIYKSTSWRITNPIRVVGHHLKRAKLIYRLLASAARGVAKAMGMIVLRSTRFFTRNNAKKSVFYLRTYGLGALARKVVRTVKVDQGNLFHRPTVPTLNISRLSEQELRHAEDSDISIIIPAKNAGSEFEYLLAMLAKQRGIKSIEIIVVDSGSTDSTVQIARDAGVKIIEIPPENFSHSYARNLGADTASGKYLLFTVQDALPPSEIWLYRLFRALKTSGVVAVSCAESPREDVDLLYRVLMWNHRRFLEIESGDRILSRPASQDYAVLRKNSQLSDVACLIDKAVFAKYRFRYDYGEDLDLGVRLVGDGYKLAILGSVSVIHSHTRPCSYYLKRWYAETVTMPKIIPSFPMRQTEYHALLADIAFTYNATTSIAATCLRRIASPCKMEDMAATLDRAFESPLRLAPLHGIYPKDNGYIDDAFHQFLNSISISAPLESLDGRHGGALWTSLVAFMGLVSEYLRSSTEFLGVEDVEEVKKCMYKAFALLCGTHLAFCYIGADQRTKGLMHAMHTDLIRGI